MFAQHININGMNMVNSQEFKKICSEHPECISCPLKDKDVQLQRQCGKPTPLGVGWIAHLFYNLMCMLPLILYTYYNIIYVWKIIIDIQTQQYL